MPFYGDYKRCMFLEYAIADFLKKESDLYLPEVKRGAINIDNLG